MFRLYVNIRSITQTVVSLTSDMLFLVSSMVNPAHRTSPLLYSSVGGWVGRDTDRRAITYGSLRRKNKKGKPWRMAVCQLLRRPGMSWSGFFYPSPLIFSIWQYRVPIRYSALTNIFLDNTALTETIRPVILLTRCHMVSSWKPTRWSPGESLLPPWLRLGNLLHRDALMESLHDTGSHQRPRDESAHISWLRKGQSESTDEAGRNVLYLEWLKEYCSYTLHRVLLCFFGCFSVLKQVSSYFSCLAECCNSVWLQWSGMSWVVTPFIDFFLDF